MSVEDKFWLCGCLGMYGYHSPKCPAYEPRQVRGSIVRMGGDAKPGAWTPQYHAARAPRRPGIGAVVAMVAAARSGPQQRPKTSGGLSIVEKILKIKAVDSCAEPLFSVVGIDLDPREFRVCIEMWHGGEQWRPVSWLVRKGYLSVADYAELCASQRTK